MMIMKKKTKFKVNKSQKNSELSLELEGVLSDKPNKTYKKISRKKPGQKTMNYITMETQDAIVSYQAKEDIKLKNDIYLKEIYPAFDSLVENLINVYGFNVVHESRVDLKNECLEFLYRTLPKFQADKGSKAFSYFNVVAKNWLTIRSKTNAKKVQTYISIDDKDTMAQHDLYTIENYNIIPAGDDLMFMKLYPDELKATIEDLVNIVKTENEKNCVRAISMLLKDLEEVDFLNKRAVLLYLREITGLNSKQLSVILASLKKHYRDIKRKEENEIS